MKIVYIALLTFCYCTANSQSIRRIDYNSNIKPKQYNSPQVASYRSEDSIIKAGLLGTWKIQDAVIQFKGNFDFETDFEKYPDISGTWAIKNRILYFKIMGEFEDEYEYQYYFIISFDGKKMEYQQIFETKQDPTIWIAVKQ